MKTFFKRIYNWLKWFFDELYIRWKSTSPYIFRVIQKISAFIAFTSGFAFALKTTGIDMGDFNDIGDKAILVGAGTAYAVARLPVDKKRGRYKRKKDRDKPPEPQEDSPTTE